MWSDNETDEDLLGFSLHADLIGEIVTDPEMLPVTIGLFGDWGGGKSSILKIIERNLLDNPDFAVIYFNSWVFEGYEDAKAAILTSLLTELLEQRTWTEVVQDEVRSLLKRVRWMKVLKSGTSAGLAYLTANPLLLAGIENPLGTDPADEPSDNVESAANPPKVGDFLENIEETVLNVRSFREDFQGLIEKTKLKALVILIDDLDRCSPERVIENLEAVKLFLNVESTAFVVATDRRIVENAIRIRYSNVFSGDRAKSLEQESLVTDYLEKLIQVPYTLPKLAPHEVRSYMALLFLKKHLDSKKFDEVLGKYTEFLAEERYSSFPLGDTLDSLQEGSAKVELTECVRLVEACSDAITDGLKGNPRQIKRFLNAYWLRKKLGGIAHLRHVKDHILIKLMVLEYISEDRFEELYNLHRNSEDGSVGVLTELELASNPDEIEESLMGWGTPRIWKWIKSEPMLSGADLRDYFWLSRSSITDTLSGVKLLSQAMRLSVDSLLSSSQTRQNKVQFFLSLSEDEQSGVIAMVAKKAMQDPDDKNPLDSLVDLALDGSELAASAFRSCVIKIGAGNLKPGLGIKLRNLKSLSGSRTGEILKEVVEELKASDTRIARALEKNSKK
tara:strand:+ start:38819 stop:40669 length:1851 start_codon:yes stop_codon:yes gene_type:complete